MVGWHKFPETGYCFRVQRGQRLPWDAAEKFCEDRYNATLPSIGTSSENRFVTSKSTPRKKRSNLWMSVVGLISGLGLNFQWIGLLPYDGQQRVWVDGSPLVSSRYKHDTGNHTFLLVLMVKS